MKSAKDMLDSLMGPSRNMAAKDRKGDDFKMDNVCTHFFVGLCPGQLLCKHVDAVEKCKLLHSVALKEELEKHPDCEKYKREYEDKYTRRLEEICSDADAKVAKEKRKCRPPETVIKLPDHLKIKVQCYEEARAERLKEANDRGEAGDLEGSQMAMRSSQQAQRDIDGINKAHTSTFPGEDVCKLCGIKYLLGGAGVTGYERLKDGELWEEDHYKSKGHEAYKQVRDALTEMRKKRREREQEDDTARKTGKGGAEAETEGGAAKARRGSETPETAVTAATPTAATAAAGTKAATAVAIATENGAEIETGTAAATAVTAVAATAATGGTTTGTAAGTTGIAIGGGVAAVDGESSSFRRRPADVYKLACGCC
eukprot:CAMPEP_0203885122 /NCGR_PEP_ID=MMETSP0359-20131031/29122_1 /ASSEMBLY_ACC=CAM_ASM_000338 /TAXON_ID=268821 /ORGANISM="Scrippsiella Hangoei, Strain SHTV-5" /LENGTH=369 /DNA_ID=CAMNT_0050805701 /DNA_START=106 /DNA_END=1213 /DNA_ORIENTATION=-